MANLYNLSTGGCPTSSERPVLPVDFEGTAAAQTVTLEWDETDADIDRLFIDRSVAEAGEGDVETAGTTALAGTLTNFTDFNVGDVICVEAELPRVIVSIESDTALTVDTAFTTTDEGLEWYVSTTWTPVTEVWPEEETYDDADLVAETVYVYRMRALKRTKMSTYVYTYATTEAEA